MAKERGRTGGNGYHVCVGVTDAGMREIPPINTNRVKIPISVYTIHN